MQTDLAIYVENRLKELFSEVAELVNAEAENEAEALGAPMGIFIAERHMIAAWRQFVADGPSGRLDLPPGPLTLAAGAGGMGERGCK